MKFVDPTFVDMVVRRRANYKIAGGNNTRLCCLLAEAVTDQFDSPREKVLGLQKWVCETVPHNFEGDWTGRSDFYRLHALDIIKRGWAACEATTETFATLSWLAGFPCRVISVQRKIPEPVIGHHVTEVWLEGKWCFVDADLYRVFYLEDGSLANCMELRERHDLVDKAEEEFKNTEFTGSLALLNQFKDFGDFKYSGLFGNVYYQEGIFSLDEAYGNWIKLTPETEHYLYGPPQHPDVQKLLEGRLPFVYFRGHTKIDDHFHHAWEPPWNENWEGAPMPQAVLLEELARKTG